MRRSLIAAGVAAVGVGVAVGAARSRPSMLRDRWKSVYLATVGVPRAPTGWLTVMVMPSEHRPFYAVVAELLDLRPEDDLLDVACGSATLLHEHGWRARTVAGLDASDIQLGAARRRLASRIDHGTAEILKGDAGALPWEDGRFSAVTCIAGMDFFPDPQKAVCEMYRVLRTGGRAVVTMGTAAEDVSMAGQIDALGVRSFCEAYARRLMENAGFQNVSFSYPPWGGTSRVWNAISRAWGHPEARVVRGVRGS